MQAEVISILNQKAGTNYRTGTKKADSVISARISEGATLEDFKKCISNKVKGWKGTEQEIYLRPETLFGTKFWGYVNEKQTDVVQSGDRRELIRAVLKAAGIRDITQGDITIYDEVLRLISTDKLPQFAVSLIRNGGEMMRPDQMISTAVKKFEREAITETMRNGKRISNIEKFIEFIQYSFRGKSICNNVLGIYKPYVIIGMDRDGNLVNQFNWKKLSSEDEAIFYDWAFKNQSQIGIVKHVEQIEEQLKIENKAPDAVEDLTIVSSKVAKMIGQSK